MKLLYAASLFYPFESASQIQTLSTAEALGNALGDDFIFGAAEVAKNELYTHRAKDFGAHSGPVLAWLQLHYAREQGITHIYSREPALLCFLIALNRHWFRLPLRFFFEAHGTDGGYWSRFGYAVRESERVFCLTALLARALEQEWNARATTVLPDAVDVDFFATAARDNAALARYGVPSDKKLVSYVGSVGRYDWKGVDIFLDARALVPDPSVLFVVTGVREDISSWQARYPEGVLFLPWIARAEAAALMGSSSVLVLPNKSGDTTSERYTSPMKLFEYMASGTPIVASDLPSIREIVDERSALLVPPNDPAALARGIQAVFADAAGASARASAAQLEVKHYSWEARARRILAQI